MEKPIVTIIIVHYNVWKQVLACLTSIYRVEKNIAYEVIVVDNNEFPTIEKDLKKKFPKVLYKKAPKNLGYGGGNNLGASLAKGKYLFFLNPDTLFVQPIFETLVQFLENTKDAAIVAPLLLDTTKKVYPLQGSLTLTPFRAIMSLSFVEKYFPKNWVYRKYYLFGWDKKFIKEVNVVPGTAMVVRKDIFIEAGRFDEKFFLFFEENDVCLRVQNLGYKIFMNPEAKLIHMWGESTKSRKDTKEIFRRSRRYYFTKHFGPLWAMIVEVFCR